MYIDECWFWLQKYILGAADIAMCLADSVSDELVKMSVVSVECVVFGVFRRSAMIAARCFSSCRRRRRSLSTISESNVTPR